MIDPPVEVISPPRSCLESISIVDLFAGAGGLVIGWQMAGGRQRVKLIGAVDNDKNLSAFYAWNFPNTTFVAHSFGDAVRVNEASRLMERLDLHSSGCDVLLAGPPCQTFSAAGKRQIQAESQLAFHVVDFARVAQPKVIIVENVPQFARAQSGRLIGRIRGELACIGYLSAVITLQALSFGVPQRRKRCFIVAVHSHLGWPCPAELIEDQLTHRQPQVSVADAISDLPALEAGEGTEVVAFDEPPQSCYQELLRSPEGITYNHVASRHSNEMVAALSQLAPGETPQYVHGHQLRRKQYYRLAYSRLHPDGPASTITTQTQNPGSGRFTHYRDHRTVTVREAARLQSFPDRVRFFGPMSVQRRHVGNATPPLVSKALAELFLPYLVREHR